MPDINSYKKQLVKKSGLQARSKSVKFSDKSEVGLGSDASAGSFIQLNLPLNVGFADVNIIDTPSSVRLAGNQWGNQCTVINGVYHRICG